MGEGSADGNRLGVVLGETEGSGLGLGSGVGDGTGPGEVESSGLDTVGSGLADDGTRAGSWADALACGEGDGVSSARTVLPHTKLISTKSSSIKIFLNIFMGQVLGAEMGRLEAEKI